MRVKATSKKRKDFDTAAEYRQWLARSDASKRGWKTRKKATRLARKPGRKPASSPPPRKPARSKPARKPAPSPPPRKPARKPAPSPPPRKLAPSPSPRRPARKPARKPAPSPPPRKRPARDRAEAARLGWELRREREAIQSEGGKQSGPEKTFGDWVEDVKGFTRLPPQARKRLVDTAELLAVYGETQDPKIYDRFRIRKRQLYAMASQSVFGLTEEMVFDLIEEAAHEAGWDDELSQRFSKLS